MEKKLKTGDVIEFNGKKYRAESEVEKGTCIGCDLFHAGESTCGYGVSRCIHFIFKEVKDVPRRLELGVVKVKGSRVTFRIVEQTHRLGDFSQQIDPSVFKASNEIVLKSQSLPEWGYDDFILFCRGLFSDNDNIEIVCTTSMFARISEAITEYNATDGKGYEKTWPQNGDDYFYIASRGRVEHAKFTDDPFDLDCMACSNFFRAEEEAKAAREKIKALLKELAAK